MPEIRFEPRAHNPAVKMFFIIAPLALSSLSPTYQRPAADLSVAARTFQSKTKVMEGHGGVRSPAGRLLTFVTTSTFCGQVLQPGAPNVHNMRGPRVPQNTTAVTSVIKRKWSLSCPHVSGCTRAVGLQSRVYSYSNSSLHTLWGEMVTLLKSTQTLCHHTEQGLSGLKVLLSVSYQQAV